MTKPVMMTEGDWPVIIRILLTRYSSSDKYCVISPQMIYCWISKSSKSVSSPAEP
jgi:hypothetical protein